MSTRSFLDTRVGTYSGLVMGPMMLLLGVYLLITPVEFLGASQLPRWLPGAVVLLYGLWRTIRGIRGLRRPAAAEGDEPSGPVLSRTAEAVAQARRAAERDTPQA